MTPTKARDRATALAASDTGAALEAARYVGDPWFGCQALAWVARFAPDDQLDAIIDEAFEVGGQAADVYQIIGSAAWPLRALVERGRVDRLGTTLPGPLALASRVEQLASRSEGLFLVYQAVFPAGRPWWLPVLNELAHASHPALHWRQARNLRDAVLMAARPDPGFARDFCPSVRNDRARRQIEAGLARSESQSPRPFFWRGDG